MSILCVKNGGKIRCPTKGLKVQRTECSTDRMFNGPNVQRTECSTDRMFNGPNVQRTEFQGPNNVKSNCGGRIYSLCPYSKLKTTERYGVLLTDRRFNGLNFRVKIPVIIFALDEYTVSRLKTAVSYQRTEGSTDRILGPKDC